MRVGGQWNSSGACDSEVEPINETYLREYPPKMLVLERVLRGMKTHKASIKFTFRSRKRDRSKRSCNGLQDFSAKSSKSIFGILDPSHDNRYTEEVKI
ncbi:hypothetical protein Tsubulata_048465 [Turnera subulata]|uniref:Uncharacterized protein n=1 Tax=Turnera subulata TaxID=218843 RepID=A0A9Q0JF67_9ROSI|nr:hypothetical protein Tsubulata_048465 [Turnera subulata]